MNCETGSCLCRLSLVGSVLLQDEAKGDSQTPVVINMDGADQRLAERQQQLQLIDEQVLTLMFLLNGRAFDLVAGGFLLKPFLVSVKVSICICILCSC